MSKRIKLIVAGTLLAVTALAVSFLAFSFSGSASPTSSTRPAQAQAPLAVQPDQSAQVAAQPDLASPDQAQNDLMIDAAPDVTGTNQTEKGFPRPPFGPGYDLKGDGSETQGIITKIENNGSKLTVSNRVVNLNDQTTLGDVNGTIKKEDLKTGDRLIALGKVETDKSLTARWVLRLAVLPSVEQGVFEAVAGDSKSFTFKVGKDNTVWRATVTDQTIFKKDTQAGKLSDFKAGDMIAVFGKADATAKKIEASMVSLAHKFVRPGPPTPGNFNRGSIKSIDVAGNSLVIAQNGGPNQPISEVKIAVDSSTVFNGPNLKSLADLKVGDTIVVQGDKQTDSSLKAKTIVRGPGRGSDSKTGSIDSQFLTGQAAKVLIDPDFLLSLSANDPDFYTLG